MIPCFLPCNAGKLESCGAGSIGLSSGKDDAETVDTLILLDLLPQS
jgi:hypothetical protein